MCNITQENDLYTGMIVEGREEGNGFLEQCRECCFFVPISLNTPEN